MKRNNDMVFTSSGCLSSTGIEDFVNKTLTGLQLQQVQEHVESCEFCKEAVEGYILWNAKKSTISEQAVTYKSKSFKHEKISEQTPFRHKIEDLNNRVKSRVKVHTEEQNLRRGKKKAMPIGWMAMAASVILLVGLFYRSFFYPSIKEKSLAKNVVQDDKNQSTENQPSATMVADTVKQIAVVTAKRNKPEQTVVIVEDNVVVDNAVTEADGKTEVLDETVVSNGETASMQVHAEIPAPAIVDVSADKSKGGDVLENPFAAKEQPAELAEAKLEKKALESIRGGRTKADVTYVDGIKVSEEEASDAEEVFMIVEQQPEFPGGDEAYKLFLQNNIRYPQSAREKGIEGTVYLDFEVNKRGKIRNVSVLRGVNADLDSEAVRVVKLMPDWVPGKQRGKAVDVQMTLPIKFNLQ